MTPADTLAAAVAARYPQQVAAHGPILLDLDSRAEMRPKNARDAIGWIAAGEWDNDGTNPRTTRLARHWHKRQ